MAAIAKKPTNPTVGVVRGKGTQTSDSIDAKLSNGESVLNAGATKALKAMLKKTGMTIDKFNDLHAPKDAETKMVDGELNAALGVDLGAQSRIDELTGVAKKTRPSAMQSAKVFDKMPSTRPATAADVNFRSGIKPTTAPTIGTPTTGLVNDTTIPQVASKTGNLAKVAGKAAVVAPLAINMYDASQDISNNPQMDTLSKVSRYANAAADQVAPLSEIAASVVNAVTGAGIETESQKLARQQGTQTDYQKYIGSYDGLSPLEKTGKAVKDSLVNAYDTVNLGSSTGGRIANLLASNNSADSVVAPVTPQKTAVATKPVEPVATQQPQVGTQNGIVANAFDTRQASLNAISPKLSTSIAEPTNTAVVDEAQPMVGVDLTGRGIVKGVGKNGETMYSGSGNGTGITPSLGVQPQKRLTEEQVRQLYRELPADSFSAAGMGGTTTAQRYETQQQPQNRLNIAQPVDPNAQRNALIAQTKQFGNVGDKAVREAAMAQLQMLDANARAEQDNQYKIAALQQGASQFEQQQQNARESAKGTTEYQSQKDKLEQSNKDREFFDKPYTKEIPVLDPTTGQETGEYKKVTTTVRQEQAEAEKKIVAEGISKAESALKLGLNPKGQPLTDSEKQQLIDYISKAKGVK